MYPPSDIVFPLSSHTQRRRLVLRNALKFPLLVRLECPRSAEAVKFDPPTLTINTNEWVAVNVDLDPTKLPTGDAAYVHVYCRKATTTKEEAENWCNAEKLSRLDLAARLRIARLRGFAARDTIVDLPAFAALCDTPPYPVFGVDDHDCHTAIPIDADTCTASEISPEDLLDAVADSCASTAHNIDSGCDTARDMKRGSCWIADVMGAVFPSAPGKSMVIPCAGQN